MNKFKKIIIESNERSETSATFNRKNYTLGLVYLTTKEVCSMCKKSTTHTLQVKLSQGDHCIFYQIIGEKTNHEHSDKCTQEKNEDILQNLTDNIQNMLEKIFPESGIWFEPEDELAVA